MRFEGLTIRESGAQTLITLEEAKAQLNILDQYDDAKISACAEAAAAFCESFLWRSFRPQTVEASYSPDGSGYAELMRADFDALVGVSYYDAAGTLQTIPADLILVDASLFVPRAYFAEPKTSADIFAPIKISYKTKQPDCVPAQVKQAALIATAQFYDDRDAPDMTAVENILRPLATRHFL